MAVVLDLPNSFSDYLESCPFTADEYKVILAVQEERYVRIRDPSLDIPGIAEHMCCAAGDILEVQWLQDFSKAHSKLRLFRVPETANIRKSSLYDTGVVFGIDASSLAAVWALGPQQGDHVLELCCAPGTKLCCLADICFVTGVDCSEQRLTVARSQVKRCKVQESVKGLWLADGQTWNGDGEEILSQGLTRGDRKQGKRKRQKLENRSPPQPFDRVLVDAECAHDGSLKHIRKFFDSRGRVSNLQALEEHMPWLSRQKRQELAELQYKLLKRGFELLKEDGVLVYSTCSFSEAQNEDVVRRFLLTEPCAKMDELPWPVKPGEESQESATNTATGTSKKEASVEDCSPNGQMTGRAASCELASRCMLPDHARRAIQSTEVPCSPAFNLPGACRFDPRFSATGAMFIARLRKTSPKSADQSLDATAACTKADRKCLRGIWKLLYSYI